MNNSNKILMFDNFLSEDLYSLMLKKFNNIEYEVISQYKEEKYSFYSDYKDENFPTVDEVYLANFCSSNNISNNLTIKNIIKSIQSKVIEVYGSDDLVFRTQFNGYRNNAKDHLRVHFDDYNGKIGYVFYMLKNVWKYDWGGLLHYIDNGDIKTILPKANRLIINNHSEKIAHWVTPVNSWAKENRNTLVGFAISQTDEIPKSWSSDYIWNKDDKK